VRRGVAVLGRHAVMLPPLNGRLFGSLDEPRRHPLDPAGNHQPDPRCVRRLSPGLVMRSPVRVHARMRGSGSGSGTVPSVGA
jgi:hypothetical protein